jgi:predicted secreted hydrolase
MTPPAQALLRVAALVTFSLVLGGAAFPGSEAFRAPRPGREFAFPRDHGAHPDYKTEWWYFVGHLKSRQGESVGYQLTFFRVALRQPDPRARSAWSLHTVYFAHLAVSDPARDTFVFREKAGRGALGLSGAQTGRLKVWIDAWQVEQVGEDLRLTARDGNLGLALTLRPGKPPALHGEGGFSRKAARFPAASYYYSLPRLETRGQLTVAGRTLDVTGLSWMDHEFFTGAAAPGQVGWDWFALQLSDGWDLMLYLLRQRDGTVDPASSGSLIDPQGRVRHLTLSEVQVKATGAWKSPHSRATYPAGWEIVLPGYRLTLTPTMADQELRTGPPARVTYWEGGVRVQGHRDGQPVTGQGYVELTGYAGTLGARF